MSLIVSVLVSLIVYALGFIAGRLYEQVEMEKRLLKDLLLKKTGVKK